MNSSPPRTRRLPTTAIAVNGAALRELRKRSGVSVSAFAQSVGVGRPYISKLELGHSSRVSPEVFAKLLRALGLEDRRAIMANPVGDR